MDEIQIKSLCRIRKESCRQRLTQQTRWCCLQVYIGETGRSMHERMKEHDRNMRLARTETSAVSEHLKTGYFLIWNEVKFIDRDPNWYTRRVKEAIHITLIHITNITSIEIMESKFLKHGCLQLRSTAANREQTGPVRVQHLFGIMMRNEVRQ